jgi:hypothetical protein
MNDGEMGSGAERWASLDDLSLINLARWLYERLSSSKDPAVADKFRKRLLRVVDPDHRAEKFARFGSHAAFLDDLAYVHRATREADSYNVGDECRCVLVMATVSTIYARIPPEAVAAHIAVGAAAPAMNLASALQFPQDAAQSLLDLAQSISERDTALSEVAVGKAVAIIDRIRPDGIYNLLDKATRADLFARALHAYGAIGAKTLAVQTLRDAVARVADAATASTRAEEYARLFSAALDFGDRGAQESIRRRIDELEPVIDGGDRDHRPRVRALLALSREFQRAGDLARAESLLCDAHEIVASDDWGSAHTKDLKVSTIELFVTMVDWRSLSEDVARLVSHGLCETAVAVGSAECLGALALQQAARADGLARETVRTYWQHTSPLAAANGDLVQHLRPRPSHARAVDGVLSATIVVEAARDHTRLPEMLNILAQHEADTELASLARLARAFSRPLNSGALRAVTAVLARRILRSPEAVRMEIDELVQIAVTCHLVSARMSCRFLCEGLRRSSTVSDLNLVTETLARHGPHLLVDAAPKISARAPALMGSPPYALEVLVSAATSVAPKVAADVGVEALRTFPKATGLQWVTVRALASSGRKHEAIVLVRQAMTLSAQLDAIDDRLRATEALMRALAACGSYSKAATLAAAGIAVISKAMLARDDDSSPLVKLSAPFVASALALPGMPNLTAVEAVARGTGHPRWRAQIVLECAQAHATAGALDKAKSQVLAYLKLQGGPASSLDRVSIRLLEVAESAGWHGIQEDFAHEILSESKSDRYFRGADAARALAKIFDQAATASGLEILGEVQRNLLRANPYPAAELALCLGGAAIWPAGRKIPLLNAAVEFFLAPPGTHAGLRQAAEGIRALNVLGAIDLARERARELMRTAETLADDGRLRASGTQSDEFLRAEGLVVAVELFSQLGQQTEARTALLGAEDAALQIKPDEEKAKIAANLLRGHIVLRDREAIQRYLKEKMHDPAMDSAGELAELLSTAQLEVELELLVERARSVVGYFERTRALGEIAPAFLRLSAPQEAVRVLKDALGAAYEPGDSFGRTVIFRLLVKAAEVYQGLRDEQALRSLADVVLEEDIWWPQASGNA